MSHRIRTHDDSPARAVRSSHPPLRTSSGIEHSRLRSCTRRLRLSARFDRAGWTITPQIDGPGTGIDLTKILNFKENDFHVEEALAAACALPQRSPCPPPATSGDNSSKDGKLTVMASFYPLQYLAEKIGGEHVSVTSPRPGRRRAARPQLSPWWLPVLPRDAVVYLAGFQAPLTSH